MDNITPALCQAVLFTPANRLDRYEKAGKSKFADGVVLDLEDAVSIAEKDKARETLVNYLKEHHRVPSDHPMMTAIQTRIIKQTKFL